MAHLFTIPSSLFRGDVDEQMVAGDLPATMAFHKGAMVWAFDATDEEAVVSNGWIRMGAFTGSLTAKLLLYTASANTGGCVFDVSVMAVTPNSDNIDLETAESFSTVNSSGDISVALTAAGDPIEASITLTNADSIAEGDWFKLAIRRDTDHADDDAAGDVYFAGVAISDAS